MITATMRMSESSQSIVDLPTGFGTMKGTIESEHMGWMRPTSKDTPISEIRKRFAEDGYVFIKNLLPKQDVLKVREVYFSHFEPTGLLEPGTPAKDGTFNSAKDPLQHGGIGAGDMPLTKEELQTLVSSHLIGDYLLFLEHPDLRRMVRDIMDWDKEVLLRRTMLRHNLPGGLGTGIHYDKLFLRDGGAYFLTAWIPIGDIALNGGGLIYLSNSTELGRTIEDDFTTRAATLPESERVSAFNVNMEKNGNLTLDAEKFLQNDAQGKGKWLISDYEAGDVVFHDPYMIHGSSRNLAGDAKIRLSTDLRFYEEGSDIDERWMKYWTPGDGL